MTDRDRLAALLHEVLDAHDHKGLEPFCEYLAVALTDRGVTLSERPPAAGLPYYGVRPHGVELAGTDGLTLSERPPEPCGYCGSVDGLTPTTAWENDPLTGETLRAAIAAACDLTNPRLSEVDWEAVATHWSVAVVRDLAEAFGLSERPPVDPLRAALPDEREIARWDREHRRECQEASCTLPHRMLAFADWYILIARDFERDVRRAALTAPAVPEGRHA